MREIKFRAYDKKQKCMCNPEITFSNNRLALDISGYPFFKDMGFDFKNRTYVEDTFEFMQYTGLKDKNGKEIYEGDIINAIGMDFEIRFGVYDNGDDYDDHDAGVGFYGVFNKTSIWGLDSLMLEEEIEVIGNIHENHELLPTD